jgi:hypothetical protein
VEEEESVLPIRFPPKLLAALFACLLAYLLAIKRKTDFVVIVVLIPPPPPMPGNHSLPIIETIVVDEIPFLATTVIPPRVRPSNKLLLMMMMINK